MENDIDTNKYYVSYCLKGVRTFSKFMPISIPAELGRSYLNGDPVVEELQDYIRENISRVITDLSDIIILGISKRGN